MIMSDDFMDIGKPDEAITRPLGENKPGRVLQMDSTRIEIPMLVGLDAEVKDEIDRRQDKGFPF
jgi:hypothetical protein